MDSYKVSKLTYPNSAFIMYALKQHLDIKLLINDMVINISNINIVNMFDSLIAGGKLNFTGYTVAEYLFTLLVWGYFITRKIHDFEQVTGIKPQEKHSTIYFY